MRLKAFLLASRHALKIEERGRAQLFVIKSSAGRLIMRKIRLPERITKIVVLIRPVEDGPDITIEPRTVIRIPFQAAGAPVDQRLLVSRWDVLWLSEGAGRAVNVPALGELANRHVF